MNKDYFIVIDGKKIPVSEEIYRAFKRPLWTEHKRRKVRAKNEWSLEQLVKDGFDVSDDSTLVDEIIEDKMLLDMLLTALAELTDDERGLIDALFFDEKSERKISRDLGISSIAVHKAQA